MSIEQFRITVLLGTVAFLGLTAVACIVAEKIRKGKAK